MVGRDATEIMNQDLPPSNMLPESNDSTTARWTNQNIDRTSGAQGAWPLRHSEDMCAHDDQVREQYTI